MVIARKPLSNFHLFAKGYSSERPRTRLLTKLVLSPTPNMTATFTFRGDQTLSKTLELPISVQDIGEQFSIDPRNVFLIAETGLFFYPSRYPLFRTYERQTNSTGKCQVSQAGKRSEVRGCGCSQVSVLMFFVKPKAKTQSMPQALAKLKF